MGIVEGRERGLSSNKPSCASAAGHGMSKAASADAAAVTMLEERMPGVALKNVPSSIACLVRDFAATGVAGFQQGWHERNGGNASYRLTDGEAAQVRDMPYGAAGDWVPLGIEVPTLGGSMFLVTAAGSYFQALEQTPERSLGIVELDDAGSAYRVRWGFASGGRPTSEFAGHMLIHEARCEATDGAARAIYHGHPASVVALSKVVPLEPRTLSRVIWKAMTEGIMVCPEGIGVVGCLVPGSLELARASAEQMRRFPAVVWASHGLLASGESLPDAFGRMHAIVKSADIYMCARMANGGNDDFLNVVPDATLRAIAASLGLQPNEGFLEGADA